MQTVKIGVVILPDLRWSEALLRWQEAEACGFDRAWTYDHHSWRSLRDGPWLGAVPLLGAVAASTTRLRLGTLVTSPNFRHPAALAKEVMTLDEISGGRFDLGVGAGGPGYDAQLLGGPALSLAERAARFAEFTDAMDVLLREPKASFSGHFYTAVDSRTLPGCVQEPRVPFTVAAAGPKALDVAARHAETWVTHGPARGPASRDEWLTSVASQAAQLDLACRRIGREPTTVRRSALIGLDIDWATNSVAAWDDLGGRLSELGFDDIVVHWPRNGGGALAGPPQPVFDEIVCRLPAA